ncbi:MAG: phosphotransferase [Candidatus Woesearchaeota archaeon]
MGIKTKLSLQEINSILQSYDIGKCVDFSIFKTGVVHSNYKIVTTKGTFVLRIFERRTKQEIMIEMQTLKILEKDFLYAPNIIYTKQKKSLVDYKNKLVGIFSYLKGKHIDAKKATPEQIYSLGKRVAEMHTILEHQKFAAIKHKAALNKKEAKHILNLVLKDNPNFPHRIKRHLDKSISLVQFKNYSQGIVHGDLHGENILFKGKNLSGIVDFDDAFYGNQILDLGCIIGYFCIRKKIAYDLCKALLQGYEEIRPLKNIEKTYLYDTTLLFMTIHTMYWYWSPKLWDTDVHAFKTIQILLKTNRETFSKNIFQV